MTPLPVPVNQTEVDRTLRSPAFKEWLGHVDAYAVDVGLDRWGLRIVLVGLRLGIPCARRYAARRSSFLTSQAWARYTRLRVTGIFQEIPPGVIWDEGSEPWHSDPVRWLHDLVNISSGAPVPRGFPAGVVDAVH